MAGITRKDFDVIVDTVRQYESAWLRDLQTIINKELQTRENQSIQKAHLEIMRIAESVGMDVQELIKLRVPKSEKPSTARASITKFRHPEDSTLEWSGMGRRPFWVVDWQAAGKSLDDLRVV